MRLTQVILHEGLMLSQGQSPSATSARGQHKLCLPVTHASTDLLYIKHLKICHMQHHFLCNINYVLLQSLWGRILK